MAIITILSVLVFGTVLCFVEVPKLLKSKYYKELWIFLISLGFGVTVAILRSLRVPIANPSDFVACIYSPISNFLKDFLK